MQPLILHLLDIPVAMGALGGVVMELQDCALPLIRFPSQLKNVIFKKESIRLKITSSGM